MMTFTLFCIDIAIALILMYALMLCATFDMNPFAVCECERAQHSLPLRIPCTRHVAGDEASSVIGRSASPPPSPAQLG